ncbi:MAG TPA: LysR family transcriptional regulator [Stellaceae bacterium]|nr:LysR family transcriptional regulator [Stellaceae bacterium]
MLDRLTLDQLRILIAVAETGSFSAAARRLGRVQSAVSQAVQALEATLGLALFDRALRTPRFSEAGRVLLADAYEIVRGAEGLRAHAESIVSEVEPELSLAVDAVFPGDVLMAGLKALSREFPHLPVTLFTEGLGGAEQRLRDRVARLGIYTPLPSGSADLIGEFLAANPMMPVVASHHELAREPSPIRRAVIERSVQLVITDRTPLTAGFSGNILSRRIWRFADMNTRLQYLLDGFGWCYMPAHLVHAHLAAGRLTLLDIAEHRGRQFSFPLHVMHERARPPGRAGRWLIAELRRQLPLLCPELLPPVPPPRPSRARNAKATPAPARR